MYACMYNVCCHASGMQLFITVTERGWSGMNGRSVDEVKKERHDEMLDMQRRLGCSQSLSGAQLTISMHVRVIKSVHGR